MGMVSKGTGSEQKFFTKSVAITRKVWYNIYVSKRKKGRGNMLKYLENLQSSKVKLNSKGDRVEQKQSRAVKAELVDKLAKIFASKGFSVKYDLNNKPVVVLDNGVIIGFDFVVKKLDSELFDQPEGAE